MSQGKPPSGSLAERFPRIYEVSRFYMDLAEILVRSRYTPAEVYIAEKTDLELSRAALKAGGFTEAQIETLDAELEHDLRETALQLNQKRRES